VPGTFRRPPRTQQPRRFLPALFPDWLGPVAAEEVRGTDAVSNTTLVTSLGGPTSDGNLSGAAGLFVADHVVRRNADPGSVVTGMSGGGLTWQLWSGAEAVGSSDRNRVEVWYAIGTPSGGTPFTVTTTYDLATNAKTVRVRRFPTGNFNSTTPIGDVVATGDVAPGTNPTVNHDSTVDNSLANVVANTFRAAISAFDGDYTFASVITANTGGSEVQHWLATRLMPTAGNIDYSVTIDESVGWAIVAYTIRPFSASEDHTGTAAATGGGVIATTGEKAGSSSQVLTGGGVLVSTQSTDRSTSQVLTGGGVIVEAQATARSSDQVLTGGGVLVVTATAVETHSGTVEATGGGVVVVTQATDRATSEVLTGGGVITLVQATDRAPSETFTGGGVIVLATVANEIHDGTAAATGGGVLSTTQTTDRAPSETFTGAGTATLTQQTDRSSDLVAAGGGVLTPSQQTDRSGTAAATGGGSTVPSGEPGHQESVTLTGGGVIAVAYQTNEVHDGTAALTGGGVLTVTQETARSATVEVTGGGVLTSTGGQDEQHDGSVVMTGGGVLVVSVEAGRVLVATLTGGGVLTTSQESARTAAALLSGGGVLASVASTDRAASETMTGAGEIAVVGSPGFSGSLIATGGGVIVLTRSLLRQAMTDQGVILDYPPDEIAAWFLEARGLISDVAVLTSAAAESYDLGNIIRADRLAQAAAILALSFPATDDGEVNERIIGQRQPIRVQPRGRF
jgi:hypothetical protein